jgi:hypothetical protein
MRARVRMRVRKRQGQRKRQRQTQTETQTQLRPWETRLKNGEGFAHFFADEERLG